MPKTPGECESTPGPLGVGFTANPVGWQDGWEIPQFAAGFRRINRHEIVLCHPGDRNPIADIMSTTSLIRQLNRRLQGNTASAAKTIASKSAGCAHH